MAPKTNCNPVKLASVITYLQKSRACHTIKDLEKQLPSVASINGMQVKDYMGALQDENKIKMEKIGSGNWYWCFASDDKIQKEQDLAKAQAAHEKATAIVTELREKLAEAAAQLEEEENMDKGEECREEVVAKKAVVEADLKALQLELDVYRDNDPTELERKIKETEEMKEQAEKYTDDVYGLESCIKGIAPEALSAVRMDYYDEWDTEEMDFIPLE